VLPLPRDYLQPSPTVLPALPSLPGPVQDSTFADSLSNKELHSSLKKLGAEMAVTDATRKYAIKQYLDLLEEAEHLDDDAPVAVTPSSEPLPPRPRRTRSTSRLGPASKAPSGIMSGDEDESASKPVTTVTRVFRSRSSLGAGPLRQETVEQVEQDGDYTTTTTTTTDYRKLSPKASPKGSTETEESSPTNPFKYLWLALFMVIVAIVYAILTSKVCQQGHLRQHAAWIGLVWPHTWCLVL